jgi:Gluconate 2-dehydrogenase subunit 3
MDRREAVKYISLLMGGAMIGSTSFLAGCKSETGKPTEWSADDVAYLDEIAETILPRTTTPGAKDAKVGQFMTVMVNDCYEEGEQKAFRDGLNKINEASKKKYDKKFMDLSAQQRHDLLVGLDREAKDFRKKVEDFDNKETQKASGNPSYVKQKMAPHYFSMMKELTLLGFFTSEPGSRQAQRYEPVPGRFDGCIPYKKGDKAYA